MARILQKDDPVLRANAKAVPLKDIGSKKINELIDTMKSTLAQENDGVGLAAPQIGVSLRLFIVSDLAFEHVRKENKDENPSHEGIPPLVYINPEIISSSKDKKALDEGCLSVRPLFGKVRRATRVQIRAHDEYGSEFEYTAKGLLAHIFQHEIDHLNGILFIDKAKDIREVTMDPENATTKDINA